MKKKTPKPSKKSLSPSTDRNAPRPPFLGGHGDATLFAQAVAQHQAGNLGAARVLYEKLLSANDHHVEALSNFGMLCLQGGRLQEGIQFIEKSLKLSPSQPVAYMNLGGAFHVLKRLDEALECCDRAVALKPDLFQAHFNRGNVLNELLRIEEALASYDRTVALKPDYVQAFFNRGNTLKILGRLDEALASYDRAIAIKPDYIEAHYNRGYVLNDLGRTDEALANCDRVITFMPAHPDAHYNRANALQTLGQYIEAVASYDRAIALRPNYTEAFSNRGNALRKLNRLDQALASYDSAVAHKPDYADAHNNRGNVLLDMNRAGEAQEAYARAISLKPDLPYALGSWLHSKMCCCDWTELIAAFGDVACAIDRGDRVSTPFFLLPTPSTPEQQQRCARIYAQDKYPAIGRLSAGDLSGHDDRTAHGRIRLGYFSSDFRNHAMAFLIAEMIERHDRRRFEVIAFSFSPPTDAPIRQRLEKAFDSFIDVSAISDREVVALARDMQLDIAIDLNGYTARSRTDIFASRAASVQVNHLGFPGTMGAEFMDYIIADATVIPRAHRGYFTEHVACLPDTYWFNDSTKIISDRVFSRNEFGLPDDAFVFCCFNNAYKITPDLFDIWMRLLIAVDGSVLWLLEGNTAATRNLRAEAERRGVAPGRLIFAPRMGMAEHLARHRYADLFIDTFYYNAHTTASDALWAGLPVLTYLGNAFAGRVAASLLNAMGLPEMITSSHAEYESLAIDLATNPELLSVIQQKLAVHRSTKPLFNTARFTRYIEAAYTKMYERYQAGLMPEHIYIEA